MTRRTIWSVMSHPNARLVWARRDTRWDVLPCQQPDELAVYDGNHWWLPCPDGLWFRSPVGLVIQSDAHLPALLGEWVEKRTGIRAGERELTITNYQRAA